jgi:hypothetical protein
MTGTHPGPFRVPRRASGKTQNKHFFIKDWTKNGKGLHSNP